MTLAYWNGEYLPLEQVRVSPLDRGYLFGDGVYEVVIAYEGHPFEMQAHFDRLQRSMALIGMKGGPSNETLEAFTRKLMDSCRAETGAADVTCYMQVTRGASTSRAFAFPKDTPVNVLAFSSPAKRFTPERHREGFALVTRPDRRWSMCDIKSVSLLAGVLASQQAVEQNALEALHIRDGIVTEGGSSNVFVVKNGAIATPLADNRILNGITRRVILRLANENGLPVEERDITEEELRTADEVWMSSTTKEVAAMITIDGKPVGKGVPGPVWEKLRAAFDLLIEQTVRANA